MQRQINLWRQQWHYYFNEIRAEDLVISRNNESRSWKYSSKKKTYGDQYMKLFMLVTGASVCSPRHRNSMYIHTVRWSIYNTRLPEHPHFANPPIRTTPPRDPLHCPVTWNPAQTRPYATATSTSLSTVFQDHCKHLNTASRSWPLLNKVYDGSAIVVIGIDIGIYSSVLAAVSEWTQLFFIWLDSIVFYFIRLTCFFIWLYSLVFRFD